MAEPDLNLHAGSLRSRCATKSKPASTSDIWSVRIRLQQTHKIRCSRHSREHCASYRYACDTAGEGMGPHRTRARRGAVRVAPLRLHIYYGCYWTQT